MRLQFWIFNECGVALHYYYSQVHSESNRQYLLGFHVENYSYSIEILQDI